MPTSGNYLLDTNIVIALFARERKVLQKYRRARAVFLSATVAGELFFGAFKSKDFQDNVRRIEEFAAASTVLSCDFVTARHYGQIKEKLRAKGRPIPDNDIWIAAAAFQYDLTVVSRDAHFGDIDDLSVTMW